MPERIEEIYYSPPPPLDECIINYENDLKLPKEKAVQVDRVFILGAGFSRAFGFTTSKTLVKGVIDFIQESSYQSHWAIELRDRVVYWLDHKYPDWRNTPPDLTTFIEDFFNNAQITRANIDIIDPLELWNDNLSWEKDNFPDTKVNSIFSSANYYRYLVSFEHLLCLYLFARLTLDEVKKDWAYENLFEKITKNDVILTFNWDVIPEVYFVSMNKNFSRYEWNPDLIKFVKLHGSIDLLGMPNDQMKHDKAEQSDRFEFLSKYIWRARTSPDALPRMWGVVGPEILPWQQYNKSAVLIMPPFYSHGYGYEVIQFNWRKARTALERAKEIIIIGYSLSESDIPFHNLINSIKGIWSSQVKVKVWNPNPDVGKRAKMLFGPERVEFHQMDASEFKL